MTETNNAKIYRCEECGNILFALKDAGVTPSCCGESMKILRLESDAERAGKHRPIIERGEREIIVRIGENEHPIEYEHHIQWAFLSNGKDYQIHYFETGEPPIAKFANMDGELKAFAYCNIHGLWSSQA